MLRHKFYVSNIVADMNFVEKETVRVRNIQKKTKNSSPVYLPIIQKSFQYEIANFNKL